jgi:hypothetical protein
MDWKFINKFKKTSGGAPMPMSAPVAVTANVQPQESFFSRLKNALTKKRGPAMPLTAAELEKLPLFLLIRFCGL